MRSRKVLREERAEKVGESRGECVIRLAIQWVKSSMILWKRGRSYVKCVS